MTREQMMGEKDGRHGSEVSEIQAVARGKGGSPLPEIETRQLPLLLGIWNG